MSESSEYPTPPHKMVLSIRDNQEDASLQDTCQYFGKSLYLSLEYYPIVCYTIQQMDLNERRAARERRQNPVNPDYNFANWKRAVGLQQNFPSLDPLNEQNLNPHRGAMVLSPAQKHIIDGLIETAVSAPEHPLVYVVTARGHGITTLARSVHASVTQSDRLGMRAVDSARVIPILLSHDNMEEARKATNGIESTLHVAIARAIRHTHWLEEVRQAGLIPQDAAEVLLDEQRIAEVPLGQLFNKLATDFHATPLLMIDMSGIRDNEHLSHVVGSIKDIEERMPSMGASLFSQMYFVDSETYQKMQGVYVRAGQILRYPPYNQAQIFAMILGQYPRGVRSAASVIDSDLLAAALNKQGKPAKDLSITEITSLFEQEILSRMNVPWADIPFCLSDRSLPDDQ